MRKTPFYEEDTIPWLDPLATTAEHSAVAHSDTGRHLWIGVDQTGKTMRLDEECAIAVHLDLEDMSTRPTPSTIARAASDKWDSPFRDPNPPTELAGPAAEAGDDQDGDDLPAAGRKVRR